MILRLSQDINKFTEFMIYKYLIEKQWYNLPPNHVTQKSHSEVFYPNDVKISVHRKICLWCLQQLYYLIISAKNWK